MARLYGRAPRGERCRAPVPHGHWKTTTFTAGLRYDGLAAPMVLDGPLNGEAFRAYVEQALVPELRPGDIVIDGKSARPQGPWRQTGDRGRWREPALSAATTIRSKWPSPNSRLSLRAAAARTIPDLWQTIADALRRFTPQECASRRRRI